VSRPARADSGHRARAEACAQVGAEEEEEEEEATPLPGVR